MSKRLDIWLVESGLVESREKAQYAIRSQIVTVNGKVAGKAALQVTAGDVVALQAPPLPYVGQGGLKLEKALRTFELDFNGAIVADIGASTGGFTDCALRHGAARVYAIDSGSGQLHSSLSADPRVHSRERLDIRQLEPFHLDHLLMDWILVDVSFISLNYILPLLPPLLKPEGKVLCLVKPQFELGRKVAQKGGIVRDRRLRESALNGILEHAKCLGFAIMGQTTTDVVDENKKNLEYLCYLKMGQSEVGL